MRTTIILLICLLFGSINAEEASKGKGDEDYIGEIMLFAGNYAPRNYLFCHGQLIAISDNPALFSILGTTYGGNGVTTFALPDLRGRVPMGAGQGPGLTPHFRGEQGGVEQVSLTASQMPAHSHAATLTASGQLMCNNTTAGDDSPAGNSLSRAETDIYSENAPATAMAYGSVAVTGTVTVDASGAGQPVYNMQPYATINYCICVQGLYPPRP